MMTNVPVQGRLRLVAIGGAILSSAGAGLLFWDAVASASVKSALLGMLGGIMAVELLSRLGDSRGGVLLAAVARAVVLSTAFVIAAIAAEAVALKAAMFGAAVVSPLLQFGLAPVVARLSGNARFRNERITGKD